MLSRLPEVAKAVAAFAAAFGGAFVTAYSDGVITPTEWVTVAVATVVATAAVFAVPNAPAVE